MVSQIGPGSKPATSLSLDCLQHILLVIILTVACAVEPSAAGGLSQTELCMSAQVTINGEAVLNATLEQVEELLAAGPPVRLEVAQPVLEEPLYIREARSHHAADAAFPGKCRPRSSEVLP